MYHVTLHGTTSFPQVTLQKKLLDCRFIVGLYLANALPEECARPTDSGHEVRERIVEQRRECGSDNDETALDWMGCND